MELKTAVIGEYNHGVAYLMKASLELTMNQKQPYRLACGDGYYKDVVIYEVLTTNDMGTLKEVISIKYAEIEEEPAVDHEYDLKTTDMHDDLLFLSFDVSADDEIGVCVSRIVNSIDGSKKVEVVNTLTAERAAILYKMCTDRNAFAPILRRGDYDGKK